MSDPELLDDSDLHRLERIVTDFNQRCGRGEDPSPEEYVQQHPHLADEIRDTLPVLRKLRDLSPPHESAKQIHERRDLPKSIGEYRILRELGRGGMGVVYHAVQESLNRTVALKVLPSSVLRNDRSRERFRREAQIAAQLHHTNIVPVFGTGQTDDVDYFAMQYIEGESLDRVIGVLRQHLPDATGGWKLPADMPTDRVASAASRLLAGQLSVDATCDTHTRIRTSQSLSDVHVAVTGYPACVARLGIQVAHALEHAHAHGVLHRDIKPSNLILDHSGTVWVTDFGLARHDEHDGLTSTGDLVGTLRYMAPERLKGQIDVRTDVYALGLTLYELLTFRPALDEHDRGQLIQSITQSEPAFPANVKRSCPRDLQTIVLKSMSKEPADRYASAQALATDLECFLAGRTVAAHPLGAVGRTWRWCRRNRVVASLATSLPVVLTIGLAVVTWQWRRAEANFALAEELRARAEANLVEAHRQRNQAELNFQRARQAVDDYLITISESTLLDVPTLEPVRAALLERAKEFYEGFVKERTDDPALQAELAASYIRLGQVEHDLNGDWLPLLTRGLRMVEELSAKNVSFAESRSWREGVYNTRSGYLNTSDLDKFRSTVDRALAIWEPLVEKHPDVDGFRADLAGLYQMRGMVYFNNGEYDVAHADFERSKKLREALLEKNPLVEKFQYALGESYTTCGMVNLRTEHFDEALQYSSQARDLLKPIADANPAATRLADILAAIHQWIALAHLRMNEPIQALAVYQQALAIQERLSREYPYEPKFQLNLANSYCRLGQSLFEAGQSASAISTYKRSFELLKQRLKDYPDTSEYRSALANAHLDLCGQLYKHKDFAASEQAALDALPWTDSNTPEQLSQRSLVHFRIAVARDAQSKLAEADKACESAIEAIRATDGLHRDWLAIYLERSAHLKARLDQSNNAEAAIREAIDMQLALEDASTPSLASNYHLHGRMLEQLQRRDEAVSAWHEALRLAIRQGDLDQKYARDTTHRLVDLLRQDGDYSAAEEVLAEQRRIRSANQRARFESAWTITAYEPPHTLRGNDDGPTWWNESFQRRLEGKLAYESLDLVWAQQPFAPDLPSEHFALRAETDWPWGTDDVELHIRYGDLVRVCLNDQVIFENSSDDNTQEGSVVVPASSGAARLRVDHIQRAAGPAQLSLWVTPVTTPQ